MEHYLRNLEDKPDSEELRQALTKAIVTIRSRLFQALLGEWRAGRCSLRGEGEEGRIRFVKRVGSTRTRATVREVAVLNARRSETRHRCGIQS